MATGTFIVAGLALVAVLGGIASIVLRYAMSLPRWRKLVMPGFTIKVAGPVEDAKLERALSLAIESLRGIWTRDTIITAIETRDLRIFVMESESWPNIVGAKVGGEQEKQYLKVGPSCSALCHELIHFLQWAVEGSEDALHSTWDVRIWRADDAYRAALK